MKETPRTRSEVKALSVRFARTLEDHASENLGMYLVIEVAYVELVGPTWRCLILHEDTDMSEACGEVTVISEKWLLQWTEPWAGL